MEGKGHSKQWKHEQRFNGLKSIVNGENTQKVSHVLDHSGKHGVIKDGDYQTRGVLC